METKKEQQMNTADVKISIIQPKVLPKLQQIPELTQQNQACQMETPIEENGSIKHNKSCFVKALNCCHRLILQVLTSNKLAEVDINQSQMSKLIEKLRNKKDGFSVVLPPQKEPKKTLVLDLDQTLIHTEMKKTDRYDFQTEVNLGDTTKMSYTIKRFGVDAFLFEMSKIFEIVVYTAGQKKYADAILNKLDPKGWISHRLYRQHCIMINKTYYLKNLKIMGRNMNECIIVDDNRMGGILQPENFYRIQAFMGNVKDRKLVRLAAFLKYLNVVQDVRPVARHRKNFDQKEIKLKENSFIKDKSFRQQNSFRKDKSFSKENSTNTSTIQQKQKIYKHKKVNSQIQTLTDKDTNIQHEEQHQQTNHHLVLRK